MKRIFRCLLISFFLLLNLPVQGQFAFLEPSVFWSEFAAVTAIYRPSKGERQISEYIAEKAKQMNLESTIDEVGNLIVKMPATSGCEQWPGYILQSHLDMVCLARPESDFAWGKDSITAYLDEGWVKAKETTLGADNGVGVAAMLSMMISPPPCHGPIEFLFTIDEEGDFSGVCGLQQEQLKGKFLLNLDSEESGEFNVGCAGGQADSLVFAGFRKLPRPDFTGLKITLADGLSGHSGVDIHRGRANCIAEILKLMRMLVAKMPVLIVDFNGGETDTAIPGKAEISFYCSKNSLNQVKKTCVAFLKALHKRYEETDPDLSLVISYLPEALPAFSESDSKRIIECLYEIPAGILAMSRNWPGNVQTSMNPGILRSSTDKIKLTVHLQGSSMPVIQMLSRRLFRLAQKYGAFHQAGDPYQPWEPGGNDELLEKAVRVHEDKIGKTPLLKVVHAGVECGELKKTYPHLQMLSFGPDIRHAHSPEEKLRIASIKPFLDLLQGILGSR